MSASHLEPPKKLRTGQVSLCGMLQTAPAWPWLQCSSLHASEQYQHWSHLPACTAGS